MTIYELPVITWKRCSRSLILRETPIKLTIYCYHPLEWINLKRLIISRIDEELLEFSYRWWERKMVHHFGKFCFWKLRYPYLMIQQFLENICLPKDLIMNILSSFIPSCPKQETRMSINKWIYKQIMVYPYRGLIWLHNKKEQTTDVNQLGLRWKLDEKKKIDIRVHTVWSHLYEILDTI